MVDGQTGATLLLSNVTVASLNETNFAWEFETPV
jgi:hypothetical protein